MAATIPGIPPNIAAIAGPLYLAYLFQWGLFGALSVQLYNYHITFPHDRAALKTLVYGVYLLELTQTIIVTRDGFTVYAAGFGNMEAFNSFQTIWVSGPLLIGIVSCLVQFYYAYRIFALSKSRVLFAVIGMFSLLQFSAAMSQAIISKRIGNLRDLATKSPVTCGIWLAGTAVCDLIITCSMVYLLLRYNKGGRFSATHTMIGRIVLLTIETGVLTAMAASLDLIILYSFPDQSYHAGITFTLAKLYSNSLLVLLNNRVLLQRGGVHNLSLRMSALEANTRSGSASTNPSAAVAAGGIHVERMTFVTTDGGVIDETSMEKPMSLSEAEA